jgi:HlyD family secretion protein
MRRRRRRWELALGLVALGGLLLWWAAARTGTGTLGALVGRETTPGPSVAAPPVPSRLQAVAALGRIEPHHGVIRVAGPPRPAVVIQQLLVEEGDAVKRGQVIAVLAGIDVQRADVARLRAELDNAERELERNRKLREDRVLSDSEWQALLLARDVARANLQGADAELELSTVRSPIDGQVLEIRAREGERVGPDGIAEIGETAAMYAVAEVYETDIGRVSVGQRARVSSPALGRELEGTVERIGLEIGKRDVLSTDPVADADARVVEVQIRLLEPELAASLTNLRVDVVIGP